MADFSFKTVVQYHDVINKDGKDKIKQYFQAKLNEATKFILEHPEFPYSGIDKDSIKISLINGTPATGYRLGEVGGIGELPLFYDNALNKYCIIAGLRVSFDFDYAVRTYNIILRDFENARHTASDRIRCGEAKTGEFTRTSGITKKLNFTVDVQVMLDPEDIK